MKKTCLQPSFLTLVIAWLALGIFDARAVLSYWDPEGQWGSYATYTAGSLAGTWENASWSRNSTGLAGAPADQGQATPINFTEVDAAVFAVGAGATNSGTASSTTKFTVTMNSAHTVAGFFIGALNPNSAIVTVTGTGTVTIPSGLQGFNIHNSSDSSTGQLLLNVPLTGTGAPTMQNNGQIFLNATNTFTGGTYLGYSGASFSGILNFNNPYSFGTGALTVSNTSTSIAGLVYTGSGAVTVTNKITWSAAGASVNVVGNSSGITFNGAMAFSAVTTNASLYVGGSGNLVTLSGVVSSGKAGGNFNKANPGILRLSGANTYVLNTTVSNGVLQAGVNGCIPSGSGKGDLYVATGTSTKGIFDLNGFSPTCNGLFGDSAITNSATGASTLTAGGNNVSSTFSGTIGTAAGRGAISLTKTGTGTLTLSGANTYAGATTINAGSLVAPQGNNNVPQTSAVTIASGATLDVQNNAVTFTNLAGRGNVVNASGGITIIGNSVTTNVVLLTTYSGYSGNIDGGSLVKNGTESMSIRGTNNNLANGVQLNGGHLAVGAGPNRLVAAGGTVLTIANGATFELAGSPGETLAQLTGSGFVDLEGGNLIVNSLIGNVYGGKIQDSDLPGSSTALGHGLRGYYYTNVDLNGLAAVRDDANINFLDFTQSSALPPNIPQGTNYLSVRWIGQLYAPVSGTYTISVQSDDGSRLWVNGQCIIDSWITQGGTGGTVRNGTIALTANTRYDIVVEYFNGTGGAACKLQWTPPGDTVSTIIPSDYLYLPGAGSFVKDGAGSLQLTASNSYSGTTVVTNGTLEASADGALGKGSVYVQDGGTLTLDSGTANNYIDPGADLIVTGAGTINLNFTGTDTVRSLSLDGGATFKAAGTYGAFGSGAQHEDSHFNGTGFIRVAGVPSATSLNSTGSSATYGSTITFTAHVTGSSGTPTGTVVFYDGGSAVGSGALDGTGTAVLALSDLWVATSPHSITATYTGSAVYAASTSTAVTETINPIQLTSVVANNKTYDQTTTATLNVTSLAGELASDVNIVQLDPGYVATFSDKNVGSNKTVSVSSLSLVGAAAGNYTIVSSTTATANINQKLVAATGSTASAKVYDGTTTATVNASAAVCTNFYVGDTASLDTANAYGTFANANVGNNKTVTVFIPCTGTDGPNYLATNNTTANITQASSTMNLVSSKNPANSGDSVTFTATVIPSNGGAATGNVVFLTNSVAFSTNALSANAATSTATTTLPVGTTPIAAQWVGDSNVTGSTNATLTETVNAVNNNPGPLTITNQAGTIIINWSGTFNLQTVPALQSSGTPWQTVPGATSPYTVPTTNPAAYYRLSN